MFKFLTLLVYIYYIRTSSKYKYNIELELKACWTLGGRFSLFFPQFPSGYFFSQFLPCFELYHHKFCHWNLLTYTVSIKPTVSDVVNVFTKTVTEQYFITRFFIFTAATAKLVIIFPFFLCFDVQITTSCLENKFWNTGIPMCLMCILFFLLFIPRHGKTLKVYTI